MQEARNKHALNVRADYLAEIRRTQVWHLSQAEVTEALDVSWRRVAASENGLISPRPRCMGLSP